MTTGSCTTARRKHVKDKTMGHRQLNLRSVNLNLLILFDALMTERNVTRAGRVLGLSQSAVSNSLAQLRQILRDRLFVRVKNEMVPSPRALSLATPVRTALEQLRAAIAPPEAFAASQLNRTFHLGMTDYTAFVLLDPIMKAVRAEAPSVTVHITGVNTDHLAAALDNYEVDMCLGFSAGRDGLHRSQLLFRDDWVCAYARRSHAPLTLEMYLRANHIVVGDTMFNHVDRALHELGLKRRNVVSLPFCLTAPCLLQDSDLVLTLPRCLALAFKSAYAIEICDLPFPTKGFPVNVVWHARVERDPGIEWLRQLVCRIGMQRQRSREIERLVSVVVSTPEPRVVHER